MNFGIITTFPNMFDLIKNYGVIKKAIKNNIINFFFFNPNDFLYKYKSIYNKQYGGGYSSSVIMIEPILNALYKAKEIIGYSSKIIYLTPQGKKINYKNINLFLSNFNIIIICGKYKGIDVRISELIYNIEEWSIGDYIVSCGEIAAIVMIDCISRYIPGVLNNKNSIKDNTFKFNLLDYPYYTKPRNFLGYKIPNVLVSGNHKKIYNWRLKNSLGNTWIKRPDLLNNVNLSKFKLKLLNKFKNDLIKKVNIKMNYLIKEIEKKQINNINLVLKEKIKTGYILEVTILFNENKKRKKQCFKGIVISVKNKGINTSFTLRKIYNNNVVDKEFKLYSPLIYKIEIKNRIKVRYSKLYSNNFYLKKKN